ncbi:MAG: hypothetical protein RL325_547 [Planctomycetota bacterium]|jgi:hypothetical protein
MARPSRRKSKPARADRAQGGFAFLDAYFEASRKPLAILVFLLPLLLLYELLLLRAFLTGAPLVTPDAHLWILTLFQAFELRGVGYWLPGALVVIVLLAWHLAERGKWRVDPSCAGMMYSESIVLAVPLLVFSQASLRIPALSADGIAFEALPLGSKIAVSIGAGIYEELLFRLGLLGLLLLVLEDVAKAPRRLATAIAIGLSAIAFMAYHPLRDASGALLPSRVVFYLAAGAYFGTLFVVRGFGIAVGAHAFYDIGSALADAIHSQPVG